VLCGPPSVSALALVGIGLVDAMKIHAQADLAYTHLRDDGTDRSVSSFVNLENILFWLDAKPVEVPAIFRMLTIWPSSEHRKADDYCPFAVDNHFILLDGVRLLLPTVWWLLEASELIITCSWQLPRHDTSLTGCYLIADHQGRRDMGHGAGLWGSRSGTDRDAEIEQQRKQCGVS